MIRRCIHGLQLILTGLMLASCGDNVPGPMSEGGIGGTGISMGRVSQIGSVYVNGIHYNTDNTAFVINGNDVNNGLNDIGVGMVVRVTGSKDSVSGTGIAEGIAYDSLLVGPVDSIYDPTRKYIGIMGQVVLVNEDTVLEDNLNTPSLTVQQLPVDTLVEVSGYPSSPGEIVATRIELKSADSIYKVTGNIDKISVTTAQFTIGGLTVDASSIVQVTAKEGDFVRVESPFPPSSSGVLIADSVTHVQTAALAEDGEELTIEGIITTRLDPLTHIFSVNGQEIDASSTIYSQDEMALAAGCMVKVEGIMNGVVLLAESIELDSAYTVRENIASDLGSGAVDLVAKTVTLLDRTVHITNSTIFESDRHDQSTFSLDELVAGDYLTAKVVDHNGELTATKLELDDGHSYNAALKGMPSNLGQDRIEILGVEVDVSGISDYQFRSERIEVKGNYDPNTRILIATRIEREDHD